MSITVRLFKPPTGCRDVGAYDSDVKVVMMDKGDEKRFDEACWVVKRNYGAKNWNIGSQYTTAGRWILGIGKGDKRRIKFLNGNSLDLRRCNMFVR